MNIESEWQVQKIARLLPKPLYLVYVNLSAYAEACGNTVLIFPWFCLHLKKTELYR